MKRHWTIISTFIGAFIMVLIFAYDSYKEEIKGLYEIWNMQYELLTMKNIQIMQKCILRIWHWYVLENQQEYGI